MLIVSEAHLLTHCVAQGLKRSEAVVLAHIAFFEQLNGGVEIAGSQWRYRTVAEIAAGTAYSTRNVTRVLATLDNLDLLERKVIWDPRQPGQRVGSYRLTKSARKLFVGVQGRKPSRPNRRRRDGEPKPAGNAIAFQQDCPDRKRQSGVNIYMGQDSKQDMELITLPAQPSESVSKYLLGQLPTADKVSAAFSAYLLTTPNDALVQGDAKFFWLGLEAIVHQHLDGQIEPGDPVVHARCANYLAQFLKDANAWLTPMDRCTIAIWTYLNWGLFADMVAKLQGSTPKAELMSSYHLEKHSFLILSSLEKMKKTPVFVEYKGTPDWLNGPF